MNRSRVVLMLALLGLIASLAVSALAGARPAQVKTRITVTETDHSIVLSKKVVPHGELVFTILNKGTLMHTFKISYKVTLGIRPRQTGRLVIVLGKGLWHYRSTFDSDATNGMKGVVKLT